jgi:hypothetical protein
VRVCLQLTFVDAIDDGSEQFRGVLHLPIHQVGLEGRDGGGKSGQVGDGVAVRSSAQQDGQARQKLSVRAGNT